MPIIRDLSKPAVDHPVLQEIAKVVKDNKLDDPSTIMGVGAPRLDPQSLLKQQILKRIIGHGSGDPAETFGKGMIGNFWTVGARTLADVVGSTNPELKSYIDHPIDSAMKHFRGQPEGLVDSDARPSWQKWLDLLTGRVQKKNPLILE